MLINWPMFVVFSKKRWKQEMCKIFILTITWSCDSIKCIFLEKKGNIFIQHLWPKYLLVMIVRILTLDLRWRRYKIASSLTHSFVVLRILTLEAEHPLMEFFCMSLDSSLLGWILL